MKQYHDTDAAVLYYTVLRTLNLVKMRHNKCIFASQTSAKSLKICMAYGAARSRSLPAPTARFARGGR